MGLKKGQYLSPTGGVQNFGALSPVDSLGSTLGGPGLPAVSASVAAGVGGSTVEALALLGEMLKSLLSIDNKLSCARVLPGDSDEMHRS
jgi:hypothetical protein